MSAHTPTTPTQDDRVMAALAHGSVLIPTWGIIVPILVWLTQREKSRFAAFHSLQAIALHAAEILAMFLLMGCYMATIIFAVIVPLIGMAIQSLGEISSVVVPFLMVPFVAPFLVFPLFFIAMAVFSIYGLVAAIQTFQGKDFRYLLIGRWVENWQAR